MDSGLSMPLKTLSYYIDIGSYWIPSMVKISFWWITRRISLKFNRFWSRAWKVIIFLIFFLLSHQDFYKHFFFFEFREIILLPQTLQSLILFKSVGFADRSVVWCGNASPWKWSGLSSEDSQHAGFNLRWRSIWINTIKEIHIICLSQTVHMNPIERILCR